MVIMGSIQVIQDARKYGPSYEMITIIDGVEKVTTMSLWVNVAFLVFLSVIIYLLSIPMVYYYQDMKKEESNDNEKINSIS